MKYFVIALIIIAVVVIVTVCIVRFGPSKFTGKDYTIPELDLSVMPDELKGTKYEYLYNLATVDNTNDYMAHPDSILLDNGNILTFYPKGHGKGAILNKISTDGGKSWTETVLNTPKSWENSLETPTVYRLEFSDGSPDKLILISGNPKWPNTDTPGGFECSISEDEGRTWSEFQRFYSLEDKENGVIPIVAMASLTRLKENGEFVDKWMGFFHDSDFYNYKTILTFDENGNMQWSKPEKYFAKYRDIELSSNMCEVEVIRSDKGQGDELCLISRSNSKNINSMISFSTDEGKSWSEPKEAPAALNGERHKAEYTSDGRILITFRSIERGKKAQLFAKPSDRKKGWISEGLIAWVGTYDDLKNGTEGDYRIKLAHIYVDGQKKPEYYAEADTGYCGNVVLADDTIVVCGYGKFSPDLTTSDGKELKTYIASRSVNLNDADELVDKYLR